MSNTFKPETAQLETAMAGTAAPETPIFELAHVSFAYSSGFGALADSSNSGDLPSSEDSAYSTSFANSSESENLNILCNSGNSIESGNQGNRKIFHDLCFALHKGERVGLYGPNGSGKTTFFRLIAGLEKPLQGELLLHNKPVRTAKDLHALRCTVGFVLQQAEDQLFCPTVLEDVAFGPLNLGQSRAEAKARASQTLCDLGLGGFENRLTHKLSGGEKKLVSIATVLAMRPEALLLDEPTNGLDPKASQRITAILNTLPTARIIVAHDWDFLANNSDRIVTIKNGQLQSISK